MFEQKQSVGLWHFVGSLWQTLVEFGGQRGHLRPWNNEHCMMANSEKIQQYEHFLNNVLRQDLKEELERRDKLFEDIANHSQLKQSIDCILQTPSDDGLRTQVDLGCNFYVQAHVLDVSRIYVNVGLGIHVELTLEEALTFINKRMKILNEKVSSSNKKSAKIKGDIRFVYELLRQLQGLS